LFASRVNSIFISAYKSGIDEHEKKHPDISLKRRGLKVLLRGQKILTALKSKSE
jgi:CIC family chloride channel protein